MPINESLLKRIKCCLNKDEHIALDPVLVIEFQNTACKQCIVDSKDENIYCYGCKNKHEKNSLLKVQANKFVEEAIKCSLMFFICWWVIERFFWEFKKYK